MKEQADHCKCVSSTLLATNTCLFMKNVQHRFKNFIKESNGNTFKTRARLDDIFPKSMSLMFDEKKPRRCKDEIPSMQERQHSQQCALRKTRTAKISRRELVKNLNEPSKCTTIFSKRTLNNKRSFINRKRRNASASNRISLIGFNANKNFSSLNVGIENKRKVPDDFCKGNHYRSSTYSINFNVKHYSRRFNFNKIIASGRNNTLPSRLTCDRNFHRQISPTSTVATFPMPSCVKKRSINNAKIGKIRLEPLSKHTSHEQKKEINRIKTISTVFENYHSESDAVSKISDNETFPLPSAFAEKIAKTVETLNGIEDERIWLATKKEIVVVEKQGCAPNNRNFTLQKKQVDHFLQGNRNQHNLKPTTRNGKKFWNQNTLENQKVLWNNLPDAVESSLVRCVEKIDRAKIAFSKSKHCQKPYL